MPSRRQAITNVFINSNNKVSGTNNNATYYIDWGSILKNNTPYRLHFTYIGGINTFADAMTDKIGLIHSDLQTTSNYIQATRGAGTTQIMGYLKLQQIQPNINKAYLTAEDNTNVPMYLAQRPTNNTFTIQIYDNATAPALYVDTAAAQPANYVMVLSFTENIDNDD